MTAELTTEQLRLFDEAVRHMLRGYLWVNKTEIATTIESGIWHKGNRADAVTRIADLISGAACEAIHDEKDFTSDEPIRPEE